MSVYILTISSHLFLSSALSKVYLLLTVSDGLLVIKQTIYSSNGSVNCGHASVILLYHLLSYYLPVLVLSAHGYKLVSSLFNMYVKFSSCMGLQLQLLQHYLLNIHWIYDLVLLWLQCCIMYSWITHF